MLTTQLPTVDEFLNVKDTRPTIDEFMAPPPPLPSLFPSFDGPSYDEFFSKGGAGHILTKFGQGAKHGWGERPLGLPEPTDPAAKRNLEVMKELGFANDYEKGQTSLVRTINETLFRGTAAAIDAVFIRAPMALFYGIGEAGVEAGIPRDVFGLVEAFPAGRGTGLPSRIRPTPQQIVNQLDTAHELYVIPGKAPGIIAREAFAPLGEERPFERVEQPTPGGVVTTTDTAFTPQDVHGAARALDPQTFQRLDALTEQRDTLQKWITELIAEPEAYNVGGQRVAATDLLLETEARNRQQLFAEGILPPETLAPTGQAALVVRLQADIEALNAQIRDLADPARAAYREANDLVPREEAAPTQSARQLQTEPDHLDPTRSVAKDGTGKVVGEGATPAAAVADAGAVRRIQEQVQEQLVAAGRTVEEAQAAASIVAAHYESRAARFNGALGTADELFAKEAFAVRPGELQAGVRGRVSLAQRILELSQKADASTYLHETGHTWLEEMRRDAKHPEAPGDLIADMRTIEQWLKMKEGGAPTRAQHEKFARGFERYLMEGQAPTAALARVFEQFKEWLTQIYQSVARLRAPINDDVRGVYDRLISRPREDPIIIPEREGAVDFATAAETAVRETPAAQAVDAADRVLATREQVAVALGRAFEDGRRSARRGPERTVVLERADGEPGVESVRTVPVEADAPLNTGRVGPKGESRSPATASSEFEALDQTYLDKAGNIRIENLNVSDDVAIAIRQASDEKGGHLLGRREVLTDVETKQLADDLGMSFDKLDKRKIGQAFNAEEIVAARQLLIQSATEVRDAAARAATGDAQGIIDYAIAREKHVMIQEQVAGITAEAGRALRAFRSLKGFEDATMLDSLFQRTIGKDAAALQEEAGRVTRAVDAEEVNKITRNGRYPSALTNFRHGVEEAWISWILSGWSQVWNAVSNAAVAVNATIETTGAAAVSAAIRSGERTSFIEGYHRLTALWQSQPEAIVALGKALRDEDIVELAARPIERERAIPGIAGQIIRAPIRGLTAADAYFKSIAARQEINVQARLQALEEGHVGDAFTARAAELVRDPTALTVERQIEVQRNAEYQTFTNPLGPKGRRAQQFIDEWPGVRFLVPFPRSMGNLFKYSVERSPFGFAMQEWRDNMMGRNGERARDLQISRTVIGTGVIGAAAYWAFNDNITGGGPSDPREAVAWQLDGRRPYSVRPPGTDVWISYNNFAPLSQTIGFAADLADLWKFYGKEKRPENEDEDARRAKAMVGALINRNLFERLGLRSVTNFFTALQDEDRYGPRFWNQLLGSVVPAAVNQMALQNDPLARDVRTSLDVLKARIPWWRETLPPRVDVWGNDVAQVNWGPLNVSMAKNDPINAEMARLGISKATPAREIKDVDLTPQQYYDYARLGGRVARMFVENLTSQPTYGNLPDGIKKQEMNKMINKGRDIARSYVQMNSIGDENDLVAKANQLLLQRVR